MAIAPSKKVSTGIQREFKLAAIKETEGKPLGYVAWRLEVDRDPLYRCRREFKKRIQ